MKQVKIDNGRRQYYLKTKITSCEVFQKGGSYFYLTFKYETTELSSLQKLKLPLTKVEGEYILHSSTNLNVSFELERKAKATYILKRMLETINDYFKIKKMTENKISQETVNDYFNLNEQK